MPALVLIVVVDLIGFGIIIPLLPFFGEHFNATPAEVGLLMASYSLAQFVAAPMWGRLSDRYGRRPVLLTTIAGAGLCYVWLAFAESLAMLFAARLIGGFMAGNISAAFAYVADITTKENRAKGMGMIGAAFGVGFVIGPAIGGLLAGDDPTTANYRDPALAAAGLSALAFLLGIVQLKESLSPDVRAQLRDTPAVNRWQRLRAALKNPATNTLILIGFLATFVFAALETTFAMWSRRSYGWGPEQNGWIFAYVGLLSAILQGGLIGKLSKRFGETHLIRQGSIIFAIGIGLIPFATDLWMLMIFLTLATYGFSIINPAFTGLISVQVPDTEQGAMMGVTRSAITLSRIAGPALAGFIFATLGKDWPFFTGAVIMLIVFAIAVLALVQPRMTPPVPSLAIQEKAEQSRAQRRPGQNRRTGARQPATKRISKKR